MTAFTHFRGRTAVVTGGASGLGKGIARALIAEGMRVVLADIEPAALERTAAELGATGLVCDVSDAASVQELAEAHSPIGVTVVCPGPTRTNIKTSSRNRPAGPGRRGLEDVDLETTDFGAAARWIEPDEVGRIVVAALRRGALYAFTHPEQMGAVAQRFETILGAARSGE